MGRKYTILDIKCTDCTVGMCRLAADSIDVVVTSPPYNIGKDYQGCSDSMATADYLDWCSSWLHAVFGVLKPSGSFFLNLGAKPSAALLPHLVLQRTVGLFTLQNTFHWIKSISVGNESSGHFKPINSDRYVTDCHEFIFHLTKHGDAQLDRKAIGVPYQDTSNIKRWAHSGGQNVRCRGNNWFIPYPTIQDRKSQRPHPASFPLELPKMCIQVHAGDLATFHVLDPFLGIGNSAMAAVELGVEQFTGFDTSPQYIAEANARLAEKGSSYSHV